MCSQLLASGILIITKVNQVVGSASFVLLSGIVEVFLGLEDTILLGLHCFHVVKSRSLTFVSFLSQIVMLLLNLLELLLPHLLVSYSEVFVESVLFCIDQV